VQERHSVEIETITSLFRLSKPGQNRRWRSFDSVFLKNIPSLRDDDERG